MKEGLWFCLCLSNLHLMLVTKPAKILSDKGQDIIQNFFTQPPPYKWIHTYKYTLCNSTKMLIGLHVNQELNWTAFRLKM